MNPAREVAQRLVAGRTRLPAAGAAAHAYAPANIALVKYWGKRDAELNLPVTSSLSVSLGPLGSHVELRAVAGPQDRFQLNGQPVAPDSPFARRARAFFDLVRPAPDFHFELKARNTVPTAAGFASSASGFAALARALDQLLGWGLASRELSILARLGSGSAARSLENGFVEWHAGSAADGMDSYGERLPAEWPELRVGALVVCAEEKAIGSREAMNQTVATCEFYRQWPERVRQDLHAVKKAIAVRDLVRLGTVAEGNALTMHALMMASRPPVLYWRPETVATLHQIWAARRQGLALYFTMDAGPNVKLLFEARDTAAVRQLFSDLEVIAPFGGS